MFRAVPEQAWCKDNGLHGSRIDSTPAPTLLDISNINKQMNIMRKQTYHIMGKHTVGCCMRHHSGLRFMKIKGKISIRIQDDTLGGMA